MYKARDESIAKAEPEVVVFHNRRTKAKDISKPSKVLAVAKTSGVKRVKSFVHLNF